MAVSNIYEKKICEPLGISASKTALPHIAELKALAQKELAERIGGADGVQRFILQGQGDASD